MRFPLLPIFANIFMEKLKKLVFFLSQLKLKRFVGSVWMIASLTSHIEAMSQNIFEISYQYIFLYFVYHGGRGENYSLFDGAESLNAQTMMK